MWFVPSPTENPTYWREMSRKWRTENPERARELDHNRWIRDREKRKAAVRAYRAANLEKLRAYDRARRAANPVPHRITAVRWAKANPIKVRAIAHARVARERGNGGRYTEAEWLALMARYDNRCGYCGSPDNLSADHRTPVSRGGTSSIDNLIPACLTCNFRKHTSTEEEFRARIAS